jgi:transcriptional regulator with GAF, ATPase, and Fis domain
MDQRLEAVAGPLKGAVFPIVGERVSIGSDPSNELSIYDASIAAAHCLVTCRGGVVAVTDLESGQGTFVNGVPVRERVLEDRDVITIGDCELVFRNGSEIALSDLENSRRNEVFDHLPAPILRQSPPLLPPLVTDVGRMARDLNALFKIAKAINSQRDLESLQKGLLQLLFEVVPADAGAIQIIDNAEGHPNSTVTWSREDREVPEIHVRRELVLRTLWERSEVVADLTSATLQPEQVLCVPLVALQKTIGVIYLASYSPANNFERDHVNFVSSVASIAAVTLESVLSMESLRAENRQLREQLAADEPMIGESLPMRQLAETVDKVAKGDAAVLIRGESGVGKEIVARAIHNKSSRAAQPFIAINCAAIPDTLIESELFGYDKGAFTGAVVSKRGKLELAAGGTLFLDEIGELDPKLQAKLLRILQEREFERVGGTNTIRFNARVLAATNKDLEHAIETKEFRQDLFYRLNVVSVSVPSLREHRQDIPLLAIHFARKYSQRLARPFKGISPEARALLVNYSWPGNVRELENAIEHALTMGSSDSILPIDLPETLHNEDGVKHGAGGYHDAVSDFKKRIIQEAMRKSGDNCSEAARMLGVHPNYLHRLIKKLKVKAEAD